MSINSLTNSTGVKTLAERIAERAEKRKSLKGLHELDEDLKNSPLLNKNKKTSQKTEVDEVAQDPGSEIKDKAPQNHEQLIDETRTKLKTKKPHEATKPSDGYSKFIELIDKTDAFKRAIQTTALVLLLLKNHRKSGGDKQDYSLLKYLKMGSENLKKIAQIILTNASGDIFTKEDINDLIGSDAPFRAYLFENIFGFKKGNSQAGIEIEYELKLKKLVKSSKKFIEWSEFLDGSNNRIKLQGLMAQIEGVYDRDENGKLPNDWKRPSGNVQAEMARRLEVEILDEETEFNLNVLADNEEPEAPKPAPAVKPAPRKPAPAPVAAAPKVAQAPKAPEPAKERSAEFILKFVAGFNCETPEKKAEIKNKVNNDLFPEKYFGTALPKCVTKEALLNTVNAIFLGGRGTQEQIKDQLELISETLKSAF